MHQVLENIVFFAFVSRHLLVFRGKVDGSQHQLVFQAVASGEFVQGFSLVTRTMNLTSATSLTAGNLLSKRSLKKSSGKSKDDEPMSR